MAQRKENCKRIYHAKTAIVTCHHRRSGFLVETEVVCWWLPRRGKSPLCSSSTLRVCVALCIVGTQLCRAKTPPLEKPFPDWDRGAGDGPSCSFVQDGRSGDHIPYFRWSGDQVAVCTEPARDPGNGRGQVPSIKGCRQSWPIKGVWYVNDHAQSIYLMQKFKKFKCRVKV